jgi:hypothetical protein
LGDALAGVDGGGPGLEKVLAARAMRVIRGIELVGRLRMRTWMWAGMLCA